MKSERKFDCAIYSQNIKHRNNVRRHEKACCAGEKEKVEYTCKMCEKKCTREEFKTPFRSWKMKALFLRRKHFHTLFFRNNLHETFLLPKKDFRKKGILRDLFYFLICILFSIFATQAHSQLRLLAKNISLRNWLYSSSFLYRFPGITGNLEQKYFTDHRTANTIQLFVAIKANFSGVFFFWTSRRERKFPRDFLIKIVTCLFACHCNRH